MKNVLAILVVLLLVIAGSVWYFVSFRLDGVIKQQIEEAGTSSIGTRVTVGSLKTSIKDGSLAISSITVANPPGFKNKNAFSLNGIEAAVDYENFDIKRVIIDRPEIIIEEKNGESNFSVMLAQMEKDQAETGPAEEGKEEPVITIHHFRMNDSRAAFESESLDQYSDLEIDAIELKNIKGTPDEVASAITSEVFNEVVSEAAKELMKAKASEKLDDLLGRN
jgi:hypothetical protein